MWFSCFRVLPGSAEAQVIWGGIVKCLLIAYFISNICAKKYQNPFMCVKVIASQRWDVFLRHGVVQHSMWTVIRRKHNNCSINYTFKLCTREQTLNAQQTCCFKPNQHDSTVYFNIIMLTIKLWPFVRWLVPASRNPPFSKRHQISVAV